MDIIIYFITAISSVCFSVWIYNAWSDRAGLKEDSGYRFIHILTPSSYFLLIVLTTGFQTTATFRLDVIVMIIYVIIILLCSIFMAVFFRFTQIPNRKVYIFFIIIFNLTSIALIMLLNIIKLYPSLLVSISSVLRIWDKIDFFSFSWIGKEALAREADMYSMLNKIIIALISYIPISILRFVYVRRQTRKLFQEISKLQNRVEKIENSFEELTNVRL